MNFIVKSFSAIALSVIAFTTFAAGPEYLITHNNTFEESNAYIANIPSLYPTPPQGERKVYWNLVKLACFGHTTTDKKCSAVIKMATNTSAPIEVGLVTLDLISGDITPKQISKNGYTLTVTGPGSAVINYN